MPPFAIIKYFNIFKNTTLLLKNPCEDFPSGHISFWLGVADGQGFF